MGARIIVRGEGCGELGLNSARPPGAEPNSHTQSITTPALSSSLIPPYPLLTTMLSLRTASRVSTSRRSDHFGTV